MNILNVKAAPGVQMPREGAPRTYITDADAVQVADSHYYRKAIADGDLVEVVQKPVAKPNAKPATQDAAV